MKIVNLTPHPINLIISAEKTITIPESGIITRVDEYEELLGIIKYDDEKIPIVKKTFGAIMDLPDRRKDTIYIVSRLVKNACPDREDVYSLGTLVRDRNNRIIGATTLSI